ncbi:MAG: CCA tRNA nucleotidyltransferase [Pseudomonadota bacterium]
MTSLEGDWLTAPDTQRIFALLADYPTFLVGGCVRNSLLQHPIKDIDFATAATPEQVAMLAGEHGLRVIPTGVEHGTVTVVSGATAYEVTTFRRDVETDGRRAVVAFSSSLEEDALRRDFTMNAIYSDAHGRLADPVNGLADIAARRVRFIENADRRIQEDYLRSLRFFRFVAWYGSDEGGMDQEALDAIARNLSGLETLSRERVGSELVRLLEAPDPSVSLAAMRATGVLSTILPGSDDTAIGPLVENERQAHVQPDARRRLAALGGPLETLRLSRASMKYVTVIRSNVGGNPSRLGYALGKTGALDTLLVSSALLSRPLDRNVLSEAEAAAKHQFPISATDLTPAFEGKALGEKLRELEEIWIESGFTLSREALLSRG